MEYKKYTVDEIDRMRAVLLKRNCDYIHEDQTAYTACCLRVEDQLRTYMINGTTPEELEED